MTVKWQWRGAVQGCHWRRKRRRSRTGRRRSRGSRERVGVGSWRERRGC
jgi:hypothetical protein